MWCGKAVSIPCNQLVGDGGDEPCSGHVQKPTDEPPPPSAARHCSCEPATAAMRGTALDQVGRGSHIVDSQPERSEIIQSLEG